MEKPFMGYAEIVKAWNDIADKYNQWDSLGEDERVEFSFRLGFRSYPNIEKKEEIEKEKLEVDLVQSNEQKNMLIKRIETLEAGYKLFRKA